MEAFESVDQNLREAMSCYSFATSEGEIRNLPGVRIASSGINYSVFNSVMFTEPVDSGLLELERRIQVGEVHFSQRGLGRSYWICDDMLSPSVRRSEQQVFYGHGMRCVAEPPGMFTERLAAPVRQLAHMDFRQVDDATTRFHFTDVVSTVFSLPFHIAQKVYGGETIWQSDMRGYVGYIAGQPVSVVTIVMGGDAVGIYSLATKPEHQGYGYAETLMRFAIAEATLATGLERTVLQTTRSGMRLYKRMGYRQVTKFKVYIQETCGSI